jgi:two-component system sensor histidine kinase TctE
MSMATDHRTAALSISDSGPGISDHLRERLFQPFATDHGARPSNAGSGLGLAICHGIVQSLGGGIDVQNREAHGRVSGLDVTVRLPLAHPDTEGTHGP